MVFRTTNHIFLSCIIAFTPFTPANAKNVICAEHFQLILQQFSNQIESFSPGFFSTLNPKTEKILHQKINKFLKKKSHTKAETNQFILETYSLLNSKFNQELLKVSLVERKLAKELSRKITEQGLYSSLLHYQLIKTTTLRTQVFHIFKRKVFPLMAMQVPEFKTYSLPKIWIEKAFVDGIPSVVPLIAKEYSSRVIVDEIVQHLRKMINTSAKLAFAYTLAIETREQIQTALDAKQINNQSNSFTERYDSLTMIPRPLSKGEQEIYGSDPEFKMYIEDLKKQEPRQYRPGSVEFMQEKKDWYGN